MIKHPVEKILQLIWTNLQQSSRSESTIQYKVQTFANGLSGYKPRRAIHHQSNPDVILINYNAFTVPNVAYSTLRHVITVYGLIYAKRKVIALGIYSDDHNIAMISIQI